MANLGRFLHTETGKIIMSILLGLGLASVFRTVCKDRNCIIFHGPPMNNVKDKIYKYDEKCYKFNPILSQCNSDKKIVSF
jgi:hypothetical protein